MTLPEQESMLERLLEKHDLIRYPTTIGASEALRELLRAVQEQDAAILDRYHEVVGAMAAEEIRAQTYTDLFPEETK